MNGSLEPINFAQRSANFSVEILNDEIPELDEIFEAILTGISVLSSGIHLPLSIQELSRIQLAPDRAQVEVIDTNGKFMVCSKM